MGEKVFFLSGRDRCAQVHKHECKIYKHVCKTDDRAAVEKSAKSAKFAKHAKCTHALQAWCIHHLHLPSPFSRFNLFMSDASLLPQVYTELKNWRLQALQQSPLVRICSSETQFETNLLFLRISSSQKQFETNLQDSDVVTGHPRAMSHFDLKPCKSCIYQQKS